MNFMFWNEHFIGENTAIITPTESYTYDQILLKADQINLKSKNKEIALLLCENTIETVVSYISILNQRHVVILMDANINKEFLYFVINEYHPKWIFGDVEIEGYEQGDKFWVRNMNAKNVIIHPDVAILLSTSGTTGNPKFVKLSYNNIEANARSIVEYLKITKEERGVLNLPLFYSYGLSILNSHLLAGATILLTNESVTNKSFWEFIQEKKATSLAGVPFTYQLLKRIGFMDMDLPYLQTLTQAGGALDISLVKQFGKYAEKSGKRFFVMYGQTEASPRISYVPSEKILKKAGSIGIAIPGGSLKIDEKTSELIYEGPNVMMGYIEKYEDLSKGDDCKGILYTGDTATRDTDGYFTLTGRIKRFVKLYGIRINLDDVEKKIQSIVCSPVVCSGDDKKMLVLLENGNYVEKVKEIIVSFYKVHESAFIIKVVKSIPHMPSGKIDYENIKRNY